MVSQLPTTLGALAAVSVVALGWSAGVTPTTCVVRSGLAFVVFAAFGVVLRHLLTSGPEPGADAGQSSGSSNCSADAAIAPGTRVGELLEEDGAREVGADA